MLAAHGFTMGHHECNTCLVPLGKVAWEKYGIRERLITVGVSLWPYTHESPFDLQST